MENTNTLSWENLSPVEQDCETYSDMYKDAYGIRPYLTDFRKMDAEQRAAEIDSIGREIERQLANDAEDALEYQLDQLIQERDAENQSRQDDEPYARYAEMEWK
jgi:hypothetical protein